MTTPTQQRHQKHIAGRRRQIAALRTLWRPLRLTTPGTISHGTAWMLLGGLYSVEWLVPAIAAILLALLPPTPPTGTRSAWIIFGDLIPAAALVFVGIAVLQLLAKITRTPSATFGVEARREPRSHLAATAVLLMAMTAFQAKDAITRLLEAIPDVPEARAYPWVPASDEAAAAMTVYDTMIGGAVEEFIVLAVPVVALRAAGTRWRVILPVTVLLRVIFHVYYGPTAYLGHIIWALTLVLLYAACGRIWPLFLAHALNNTIASLYNILETQNSPAAEPFASLSQGLLHVLAVTGLLIAALFISALRAARCQRGSSTPARHT